MQEAYRETILSFEVGSMKPKKRIYRVAERYAEVPRERILFLDDKLENVEAAKQRGWQAVHCIGDEQAECASEVWGHREIGECHPLKQCNLSTVSDLFSAVRAGIRIGPLWGNRKR